MAPGFAKIVRTTVSDPPGDRVTLLGRKDIPRFTEEGNPVRLTLPENPWRSVTTNVELSEFPA